MDVWVGGCMQTSPTMHLLHPMHIYIMTSDLHQYVAGMVAADYLSMNTVT